MDLSVYVITAAPPGHVAVARAAAAGGASVVQFRAKAGDFATLAETAAAVGRVCRRAGLLFLVNDRVDLAWAVGADGVHLGRTDMPIRLARRLLGRRAVIGASAGDPTELGEVLVDRPDYVGCGPVYPTITKADAGTAIGVDGLAALVRAASPVPVVAIGGITATGVPALRAAGASGVAAVSAVAAASDPAAAVRELRHAWGS